ncbi:MAG: hypothetical protein IKN62_05535 [Elusimicrobia bacterium]|nr:hypothetical protein [Elusimicrobiota bacterium]
MTKLPKTCVPVSIGIPFDLLAKTDEIVEQQETSRSNYVVQALREKIERDTKNA